MLAESPAFYVSYGALWVLVLGLALLVLLLYRHFGLAALGTLEGVQRDGLAVGEEAREITGVDAHGDPFVWAPGAATFLMFAASECRPCADVLPSVNHLAGVAPTLDLDVLTIVAGAGESATQLQEKYGLRCAVVAEDGSGVFDAYRVRVTPFAFVIGEDGQVRAKGLCNDPARLHDLLEAGGMEAAAGVIAGELRDVGVGTVTAEGFSP
jgi:AhpC/TSA family